MPRINSYAELEAFRKNILSQRDARRTCITLCSGSACHATGSGDVAKSTGAEAGSAVVPVAPPSSQEPQPQAQVPAVPIVSQREQNFRAIRSRIEEAVADQLSHLIDSLLRVDRHREELRRVRNDQTQRVEKLLTHQRNSFLRFRRNHLAIIRIIAFDKLAN